MAINCVKQQLTWLLLQLTSIKLRVGTSACKQKFVKKRSNAVLLEEQGENGGAFIKDIQTGRQPISRGRSE